MTEPIRPIDNLTAEAERGRSQFYRAILIAGIFLLLALGAAVLLVREKGKKLIPGNYNPHPTSELIYSAPQHQPQPGWLAA